MALLAGLVLFPALIQRLDAPANYGAHALTSGFGRGRLDLQGIVSEGAGGTIDLPKEALQLTLRLSGDGPVRLQGEGVDRTIVATETPANVRVDLPGGGTVSVESASRIRLYEMSLDRQSSNGVEIGVLAFLSAVALFASRRRGTLALASAAVLVIAATVLMHGRLSGAFATIAFARLVPLLAIVLVFLPLGLALRRARFVKIAEVTRLGRAAFLLSLAVTTMQLVMFDQPIPLGDPGAYFEMGGKFAAALQRVGSPLGLGPILTDLRPYLALPATGLLYGLIRWVSDGLVLIYVVQTLAMATAVGGLVSVAEWEFGQRAGRFALVIALIHPTFAIAPGIVQPEPFILAAWTMAALLLLRGRRGAEGLASPTLLGAGMLLGLGLALHPQGLSFLLLALLLCLLPWAIPLREPRLALIPLLGAFATLLPVAAAERFSKPLAHVLDKEYGFFAYTSPHPLGFWLYVDSDGWQGPLRIEDTTYQKELIATKGEGAVSSTFADVAAFVARHPGASFRTVLTNLHRLWQQPDNPFAVSYPLSYDLQVPLHRAIVVLFVLSLPLLLGSRAAILALPFVMLSMTYPAYHVFNKYATPALPFLIIGAAATLSRLSSKDTRPRLVVVALGLAAFGALAPAGWFAKLSPGADGFLWPAWLTLWAGLGLALARVTSAWGRDRRSRILAAAIGATLLLVSSMTAAQTDTERGEWSLRADLSEVVCRAAQGTRWTGNDEAGPAWLFVDLESVDSNNPRVTVNGAELGPMVATMPTFGLATIRGHRDPLRFRQLWRVQVPEDLLRASELRVRVSGGSESVIFGDVREGNAGARLSLGQWPYLSVYRLMHEGQYRLPTFDMPPQACTSAVMNGRPGIFLARIPDGEDARLAARTARPLNWLF